MEAIIVLSINKYRDFALSPKPEEILEKQYKLPVEKIKEADEILPHFKDLFNIVNIIQHKEEIENIPYFYYDKGMYKIKTEDIPEAAKFFKEQFSPELQIGKIISKLNKYELAESYSQEIKKIIDDFSVVVITRLLTGHLPIIVFNAHREPFTSVTQYNEDFIKFFNKRLSIQKRKLAKR